MFDIILTVHLVLCVALIGLVLLQQGKGADVGATFGGGNNTLFGAGGAVNMITKVTTTVAISFMVTSILLVRAYGERGHVGPVGASTTPLAGSVMEGVAVKKEEPAKEEPKVGELAPKSMDSTAPGAVPAPAAKIDGAAVVPEAASGAASAVVVPAPGSAKSEAVAKSAEAPAPKVASNPVSNKPSKGTAKAAKAE